MRVVDCQPYDAKWWEVRRGVPTASEFGSIITPKKAEFAAAAKTYACKLIADKYDGNYGPQSDFQTWAMREGHRVEPEARAFYEFQRGLDVQQVGFIFDDQERFGCSPDSLVGDDGGLEVKHPEAKTHVQWLLAGGIPAEHKPQVHGCMIVTGRDWWDFLSYVPNFPKLLVRVERDDYTKKLEECLEEFWPMYQEMLKRVEAQREEAIAEKMARQGDVDDPTLKAFVA